jgi:hypothetical protein
LFVPDLDVAQGEHPEQVPVLVDLAKHGIQIPVVSY